MNRMNKEEVKLNFINDNPFTIEVTCNRQDEDLVYRKFEMLGFGATARAPGYFYFRKVTMFEKFLQHYN